MNPQGERIKETVIKALAVVGFVAILFAGLWGSVQVIKLAPKTLSSIASNLAAVTSFTSVFVPSEKITINTPNSFLPSGSLFELTWEHKGKPEGGTYTFEYTCGEGFSFEVLNNDVLKNTECSVPHLFSSESNVLSLIPTSEINRFVDTSIVITSFDLSGEATTLDDSFLTIENKEVSESSLASESDETTTIGRARVLTEGERVDQVFPISDSRSVSDTSGRVDLEVRIIDTGVIDENNIYLATPAISVYEQGAVRFSVTNTGSKTSDNWTFNAVLPTFPTHIFHSENQKALAPGDRIDFTLGYDQLNRDLEEGIITINVDPSNSIRNEVSEENNIAQTTITITQ